MALELKFKKALLRSCVYLLMECDLYYVDRRSSKGRLALLFVAETRGALPSALYGCAVIMWRGRDCTWQEGRKDETKEGAKETQSTKKTWFYPSFPSTRLRLVFLCFSSAQRFPSQSSTFAPLHRQNRPSEHFVDFSPPTSSPILCTPVSRTAIAHLRTFPDCATPDQPLTAIGRCLLHCSFLPCELACRHRPRYCSPTIAPAVVSVLYRPIWARLATTSIDLSSFVLFVLPVPCFFLWGPPPSISYIFFNPPRLSPPFPHILLPRCRGISFHAASLRRPTASLSSARLYVLLLPLSAVLSLSFVSLFIA